MKYYFAKNKNRSAWWTLIFSTIFPLWAIASILYTSRIDERLVYGCIVLFPLVLLLCFIDRRRTSYAKIMQSAVTSYSMFGRKLCSVALDRMVYYIPFEAYLSKTKYKGEVKPYIALSNQPFTYHDPAKKIRFFMRYDVHTIVVLPYDDRTKPLLPIEKWIQVV